MKTSKLTEEQIAFALRKAELRTCVAEVCGKMDVSEQTIPPCHRHVTKNA
jgi:putative transposase